DWYGSHGGFEGDIDSIAPGDSLRGFALRSPYLPGIRQSWAAPTFRSCCTNLRPRQQASGPEYPNPSEFKILGWTVGPTYAPGTVTLDVMAALLTRVCGELAWVERAQVCHSLRAKLNQGVQVRGDRDGSSRALLALL